ncbi:MAG: hypothetical protein ACXWXZ_04070 [Candidatus Binatia bacterium]
MTNKNRRTDAANRRAKMGYIVNFGPNTDSQIFDSMEEIEIWLDDYIIQNLQSHEDFETSKQNFIDNQIEEIDN